MYFASIEQFAEEQLHHMHQMVDHLLTIEMRDANGILNLLTHIQEQISFVRIQMEHRQQVEGIAVFHVHQIRIEPQHLVVVALLYHQVEGQKVV